MGEQIKDRHQRLHTSTSDYYVNEDGSVTKKSPKTVVKNDNSKSIKTIEKNTKVNSRSIVSAGTVFYIIATVIFFVLLVVNTYEDGETIVDWIEILIGLSFISGILYALIIRPILNWLNDLI